MEAYFVSDDKGLNTGIGRYSQTILSELKKEIDIKKVSIKPQFLPKFLIQLFSYFNLDVETTWQNYPLRINFAGKGYIWHFANQQLAFSLLYRRPEKSVITVHDIIPLVIKGQISSRIGQLLFSIASKSIKKADLVIADSAWTKKDIVKHLGIEPQKIYVVPLAVDHSCFFPKNLIKNGKTILYVGSEMPRKNLACLIKAFALLKKEIPDLKLVKVGNPQWPGARKKILGLIKSFGLEKEVLFKDNVKNLAQEYSSADLFVFPSLYEGFGLPVLEAMACGCPVICSNATSLPEVGGDAVLYFNPNNAEELAEKIIKVLNDSKLQEELRQKGLERAKEFTWEKTAQKTIEVYKKIK